MAREPSPERRAAQFARAIAAAAALAWLVTLVLAWRSAPALVVTPAIALWGLALLGAYVALQFWGFDFEWRGHWLSANFDEAVLFVSLVALPGALPLVLVPLGELVVQAIKRRPGPKAVFNVAQLTFATVAAWECFAILREVAHASVLVCALVAVPVYVAVSNLLLAGIFAELERESIFRVYAQRLAPTTLLLSIVGASAGIAVVALAAIHPLAILALSPFVLALRRNTELVSRADRELRVHRALADSSSELVERWTFDAVADHILATCAIALPAGRAQIEISGAGAWSRDYEGGALEGSPTMAAPLRGRDGEALGSLRVQPRAGQPPLGEVEEALVRAVAAQAANAVLHVRAVQALEAAHHEALAQRDRIAKQEKLSALGMLIANVAHEIGNPLSYVRVSLHTLQMQADKLAASPDPAVRASAESLRQGIATARKGADNVVEISNSLRAVARQGRAGTAPVDLNQVARDVANVVRVGFAKELAIDLDLETSAPVVVDGNVGEITQVVLNLAKNAAEAIHGEAAGASGRPRDGRIVLSTRAEGDRAVLRVIDDGPGIPRDTLARLFTPFFTTKEEGTGIGLHISQGIARAHGGDLTCSSVVGEGSTFALALPRSLSPESAQRNRDKAISTMAKTPSLV